MLLFLQLHKESLAFPDRARSAAMQPATPNFNFAQQAGPSSPPETPTTPYAFGSNRRYGMHFPARLPTQNGDIIPSGEGKFSYQPSARPDEFSPRSSSPASSVQSSTSGSPPRSVASSRDQDLEDPLSSSSPPPRYSRTANFTVEEFGEKDYEGFDSDDESVIRPHQYEDAESDRGQSVKSVPRNDLPQKIYTDFDKLNCNPDEREHEAWVEWRRAENRRKRRSSGSVQKRTFSQSIGSDSADDEDLQPFCEGANEAGSSARRLRRKGEERTSLIFDDPPPRIDELEEPESCEEVVEVKGSEDEGQGVDRNLPYYVQDMDVDSDEEED